MAVTRGAELVVRAWGAASAPADQIGTLRRTTTLPDVKLEPGFLKNADDQTVLGFVALARAMTDYHLTPAQLQDWTVLGAPRFVGRPSMPQAMTRFAKSGPSSVSVHIIPHQSLHSLSGAISLALGTHGPNFGVGGGPGSVLEGLLTAATYLDPESSAGVLLCLTDWEPEPIPNEDGRFENPAVCHALVLALRSPRDVHAADPSAMHGPRFLLQLNASDGSARAASQASTGSDLWLDPTIRVAELTRRLQQSNAPATEQTTSGWEFPFAWGATLKLAG